MAYDNFLLALLADHKNKKRTCRWTSQGSLELVLDTDLSLGEHMCEHIIACGNPTGNRNLIAGVEHSLGSSLTVIFFLDDESTLNGEEIKLQRCILKLIGKRHIPDHSKRKKVSTKEIKIRL